MNRLALESAAGARRASVGSHLQQLRGGGGGGRFSGGGGGDADDGLDLFSRASRSGGDPIRLEKIAVGSRKGMEDLLDAEIGKHDYDWLLTPPETPLYPSAVPRESPLSSTAPLSRESTLSSTASAARESPLSTASRGRSTARSVSNTRPSRLSASHMENCHSTRPVRSSSVNRASVSSTYSSSSYSNNRTSVLNTSTASVTSSRPSTPGSRSSAVRSSSTARPSLTSTTTRPSSTSSTSRPSSTSATSRPTPASTVSRSTSTSRSVPSRLPTPTRTRPNPTIADRTARPPSNSRPSTPTSSRPQTPSSSNPSLNSRINSRPSTPTRRPTSSSGASASNAAGRIPSVGRISSANTRNPTAPSSRPSSPGPRPRAPVRPIDLPDFPVDAPPNLRTKLPERPASAGRTRPGMALTLRANSNLDAVAPPVSAAPPTSNRRNYMPVMSKGRFPENPLRVNAKLHGNNGHEVATAPENQKMGSDGGLRRPVKPASATESTGFGRTISKKSLDMALRHMDIRQGMGGIRASSLFPQSIRSTSTKGRPARKSDPVVPLSGDETMMENGSCNGTLSPDCRSSIAPSENGDFAAASKSPDRESLTTRDSELDLHGSSRYDAFMLKEEDSKNMNWLHSVEDKSDQSPVFDHRFEPLPEPFGML